MNWASNQAALTEMFARSFAPLTQLSAGQLALQQQALERDYAARQFATQRAQAYEQQLGLMKEQDRMAGARLTEQDRMAGARITEGERLAMVRQLAGATLSAELNRKSHDAARRDGEVARARELVSKLGLSGLDQNDPSFVETATEMAAQVTAKGRKSATETLRKLDGLTTSIQKLSDEMDVPAERQVQIAKRYLMGAALDDKARAAYAKLNDIDAIMDAAANTPGALDAIDKALTAEQRKQVAVTERKLRPLVTEQTQLQRTLQALETRGISPDWDSLRSMQGQEGNGDEAGTGGNGAPPPPPGLPGGKSGSPITSVGPTITPLRAFGNAAVDAVALPGRAVNGLSRMIGAGVNGLTTGNFAVPEQGIVDMAGDRLGGSFSDEEASQRNQLGVLNALIHRTQDPAMAGRLRAARYAPEMPSLYALMAQESNPENLALLRSARFGELAPMAFGN